jgi:HAD superfamily phosphatase (TIGR01668 family)
MKQHKIKKSRGLSEWIRARFFPDRIVSTPEEIDFEALAAQGVRIVLVDIDNTIALHGSTTADAFAERVIERIKNTGLCPVIVSNAGFERARSYADSLGVSFIAHARKPSIDSICQDLAQRDCPHENALVIGDQLLTDVLSARRAGIPVILTEKRSQKEFFTVRIKRPIESILIMLGGRSYWEDLKGECHDRL